MILSKNTSVAKTLRLLQWGIAGSAFLSILVFVYMMVLFRQTNNIEFVFDSEGYDRLQAVGGYWTMSLGVMVIFLALGLICFMVWLFRAYRNMKRLEIVTQYWLGWAVLGFLIPFANYILPILILQEILKGSHKLLRFFDEDAGLKKMTSIRNATVVWWGIYVVALLAVNIVGGRLGEDNVMNGLYLGFALSLATLALALLGNHLVRHHHAVENRVYALWESGRIDAHKAGREMPQDGSTEEEKPGWYKEDSNASYEPDVDVFRDQEEGSGE